MLNSKLTTSNPKLLNRLLKLSHHFQLKKKNFLPPKVSQHSKLLIYHHITPTATRHSFPEHHHLIIQEIPEQIRCIPGVRNITRVHLLQIPISPWGVNLSLFSRWQNYSNRCALRTLVPRTLAECCSSYTECFPGPQKQKSRTCC